MNKILKDYKTRIIWLLIGLLGALIIARTINGYEELLRENIVLVGFVPVVIYVSDAVGTQMESVIIRELTRRRKFNFGIFFNRQFFVTLLVATTLSVFMFIAVYLFFGGWDVALTVGLGLFVAIMTSLLTGSIFPYLFWKFHQDPAEASGPIATVAQDLLSVVSFFIIATTLLN